MIKLLLVEDEEKIRKGIKNVINWDELGICLYGEASNGYEALKLVYSEEPDIILTDIKMPIMDGLQLIEKLKKEMPKIKSIIMSGYDDFEYIQRAIKLGVSDYLLKPSGTQEIRDVIEKVKNQLLEERGREWHLQNIMDQFKESISLIREKYLSKLITSKGKQLETLSEKLRIYNISFKESFITVIITRIIDLHSVDESCDIELMKFAVKSIVEKTLRENYNCEMCENSDDIISIINTGRLLEESMLFAILKEIRVNLEREFNYSVCFGVGRSYENVIDANLSYKEAVNAMEEMPLSSDNYIAIYTEELEEGSLVDYYPLEEENEILECIKSGSKEVLFSKLEQYFSELNKSDVAKYIVVKSVLGLLFSLYHLCIERNINTDEIFGSNFLALNELQKNMTMDRRKDILIEISLKIYMAIHSRKSISKILKNATKFIQDNYYKDLNRKIVAQEVYITPSYLSLLFKKEMNTSFIDYLHNTRIQRACEFLKDIRYKTYDVAIMVGYSDEKYFFQVFKKYKGMTPMQYRNNLLE